MSVSDIAIKVKSQEILIAEKGDNATDDDYRYLRELKNQYFELTSKSANAKY